VEADNHVSVFWPGENAAFEGTVILVSMVLLEAERSESSFWMEILRTLRRMLIHLTKTIGWCWTESQRRVAMRTTGRGRTSQKERSSF
jgi:hypothetical protein